jgi:hypothetical protein
VTDQSVFVLGSDLQALEPAAFETEAEFQELLARHPRVLDFGSLADGQPLRLVLVAREMGVSTSAESSPAYWLDHLFVDADGVPTLVEVKRASDTRIRREVVRPDAGLRGERRTLLARRWRTTRTSSTS